MKSNSVTQGNVALTSVSCDSGPSLAAIAHAAGPPAKREPHHASGQRSCASRQGDRTEGMTSHLKGGLGNRVFSRVPALNESPPRASQVLLQHFGIGNEPFLESLRSDLAESRHNYLRAGNRKHRANQTETGVPLA